MKTSTKTGMVDFVEIPDALVLWLGERHKWLLTAANLLVQRHLTPVRQAEGRAGRGEGHQSSRGCGDEGVPGMMDFNR